jgi:hypothetical protein
MRAACLASGLLFGCSGEPAAPEVPPLTTPILLAQAEGWTLADPTSDPFAPFEPGRVRCDPSALRAEGNWIEVSTLSCNYATLVFSFPVASRAGNLVRGEVAWSTLAAIDPALATLAFALGEQLLWSNEVAIPGQANLVSVEFALPATVQAGEPLYFHVRNHGYNSWQLSPLALAPPR